MSELEAISRHIQDKTASIQLMLDLSTADVSRNQTKKLGLELFALEALLEVFEKCVGRQEEQLKQLKALEELFEKNLEIAQHLRDNIPAHIPKQKGPSNEQEPAQKQEDAAENQPIQQNHVKPLSRRSVREMEFISVPEFDNIPQYMKGRVSYDQLNAAVQSFNTVVAAKYKILHQSARSLNQHSCKLHQRFRDQETKDTKGQYFVVEEDFREFTQMKVDKRFTGMLNMLRHCQRLRELRGGGVTRFMLL